MHVLGTCNSNGKLRFGLIHVSRSISQCQLQVAHAYFTSSILAPELVVLHLWYVRFFFIFHAIQLAIQNLAPVLAFSFQRIFHKHITWNEAILHSHGSIVSLLFIMKIIYLLELQPEVLRHNQLFLITFEQLFFWGRSLVYTLQLIHIQMKSVAFGILHCRYCRHISWTYVFLVSS